MRRTFAALGALVAALVLCAGPAWAVDWGLKKGTPELKSAGALAFGPEGILLVGDSRGAAVFAIETGDTSGEPAKVRLNLKGLNTKVADALGTSPAEIRINDLKVNPLSGNVYLSVSSGPQRAAALVRIDAGGKISPLPLKDVAFSQAVLADAPEDKVVGEGQRRRNLRDETITDLAYVEGRVLVSGLSSAQAPSTVRELAFPFVKADPGTSLEIYHGAHGRFEDNAVVRVFVPFMIDDELNVLAGFTCTPLVKFPVAKFEPGKKVRGTTLAELGNRNRPLDMIVYQKDGKDYLLLTNSARGVMKVSTDDIQRDEGITERVAGGGTAGQAYETIESLKNVVQLDRLNDEHAVIVVQSDTGTLDLQTIPLP